MRSLMGACLIALMATAAVAQVDVTRSVGGLSQIVAAPGDIIRVDIGLVAHPNAGQGSMGYMLTAQCQLAADQPMNYLPLSFSGTNITNYGDDWDKVATSLAAWADWFEASPINPSNPKLPLTPLPGGPLPTPSFGSGPALGYVDPETPTKLGYIDLQIPASSDGSTIITVSPIAMAFGNENYEDMGPGIVTPLVITPEPVSALLLLAGVPMLRRRR